MHYSPFPTPRASSCKGFSVSPYVSSWKKESERGHDVSRKSLYFTLILPLCAPFFHWLSLTPSLASQHTTEPPSLYGGASQTSDSTNSLHFLSYGCCNLKDQSVHVGTWLACLKPPFPDPHLCNVVISEENGKPQIHSSAPLHSVPLLPLLVFLLQETSLTLRLKMRTSCLRNTVLGWSKS